MIRNANRPTTRMHCIHEPRQLELALFCPVLPRCASTLGSIAFVLEWWEMAMVRGFEHIVRLAHTYLEDNV